MESFKPLLAKLVKTPDLFTPADLRAALDLLFTPDVVPDVQVGAFLAAMHTHRLERDPNNLVAAAEVLNARAVQAVVEDRDHEFVIDIVGTGGDGHNTFNVSTTAAIVAAGAGARVLKHGSRASTSSTGSADLLQSVGCVFVPPTGHRAHLPRIPFTFILAPDYHPALAYVAPYRRALPFRTLFNIMGPLINPARPDGIVLGVAERQLGLPFAEALREGGMKRAMVVCGAEGLDEISCAGETHAWILNDKGEIVEERLHPNMFGLPVHPLDQVKGGDPAENSDTLRILLTSGEKGVPERLVPVLDFVLLNAAAVLVVSGVAKDYEDGVRRARESVTSGTAWDALQTFCEAGKAAQANRV